jgi:hypothetical protein
LETRITRNPPKKDKLTRKENLDTWLWDEFHISIEVGSRTIRAESLSPRPPRRARKTN